MTQRTEPASNRLVRQLLRWIRAFLLTVLTVTVLLVALAAMQFHVFDWLGWSVVGKLQRAEVHFYNGDFDATIAACDQGIRMDPEFLPLYEVRGNAYEGRGDYYRAMADYNVLVTREPDNSAGYYARGRVYAKSGESDRTLSEYMRAVFCDADNTSIAIPEIAAVFPLWNIDDEDQAIEIVDQAMDEIIALFTEALQHDPDNKDLRFCRDQFETAKSEYRMRPF